MIYRLQLELHTFCNRACPWCFVGMLGRNDISKIKYMSDEVFFNILNEIKDNIDLFPEWFDISLIRHQEPLFESDILLKRSRQIKEFFTEDILKGRTVTTTIHTNGDYLNSDTVKSCEYLNMVSVNDYDGSSLPKILSKIDKSFDSKLIKGFKIEKKKSGTSGRDSVTFKYKNTFFRFYIDSLSSLDIRVKGASSTKEDIERATNKKLNWEVDYNKGNYCEMIGKTLQIEWNGNVMTCCDAIQDLEKHMNELCLGNISEGIPSLLKKGDSINISNCESCAGCSLTLENCLNRIVKGKNNIW